MIIDAYSHVCPEELLDAIEAARPGAEVAALRKNSHLYDAERRIAYMDGVGVDVQALVLVRPPMWLGMDLEDVHRLTRVANESISAMCRLHPDRFVGVGVLPVVDEVTLGDFERSFRDLDLRGVLIFSNIEGRPIDEPPMWDLYERAAAWDLPIWIHPQHGHYYPWIKRDLLDRLFGWPFDTTLAMARLVFGGVFERFPDLKVVTHHLGGMVPYYAARADAFREQIGAYASDGMAEESGTGISGLPSDHFRRFYNDSNVSGSASALRCGIDFFGADHIVFGTDFPMGPDDGEEWPRDILRSVVEADVPERDRQLILAGNAQRLLRLTGEGS